MVNPGHPSRACSGCRTLKAKCDERRPSCSRCVRRGKPCIYRETAFRDMNSWSKRTVQTRVADKLSSRASRSSSAEPLIPSPPSLIPLDWVSESIGPFLKHFVEPPDSMDSTWGVGVLLERQYTSSLESNPHYSHALHACSLAHLANVSKIPGLSVLASQAYGLSLIRLATTMQNHQQAGTAVTLSTIMLLALYETITGTLQERELFHAHGAGQVLGLSLANANPNVQTANPNILSQMIRHVAMRDLGYRRRPSSSRKNWPSGTFRSWLDERTMQLTILAAESCARVKEIVESCALTNGLVYEDTLSSCIHDALAIEYAMVACIQNAPAEWRPIITRTSPEMEPAGYDDLTGDGLSNLECAVNNLRFSSSQKLRSIPAQSSGSTAYAPRQDVYPSQNIALLWNSLYTARIHHLRAMIDLRNLETKSIIHLYEDYPSIPELCAIIFNTVHDMCASVPYIMGDVIDPVRDSTTNKSSSSPQSSSARVLSPRGMTMLMYYLHKICAIPGVTFEVRSWAVGMLNRIGAEAHLRQGINLARLYSQERPMLPK